MPKIGVLLINTGTPDTPTEEAIRRYLAQMLMDPLLISAPPFIWKRVLKYVILPKRPAKSMPAYKRIWTEQGSKFMLISISQRDSLQAQLGNDFEVVLAMRYGNPSIARGLEELRAANCETVVAVPLYPQYATVCAGTCLKEVHRCLEDSSNNGWEPHLIELRDFYEQPAYLQALADSIKATWPSIGADAPSPSSKLVFSWHSTLMADIEAGDPYRTQCEQTAAAVAAKLGLKDDMWMIAYQSRFDSRKWLGPLTDDCLGQLARTGIKDVAVVCPGFIADNLETLVEVNEVLRAEFIGAAAEGAKFTYIPSLNDTPALIEAISLAIHEAL